MRIGSAADPSDSLLKKRLRASLRRDGYDVFGFGTDSDK